MKRSELNQIIDEAVGFCREMRFLLPPFAHWSLEDWKSKGEEFQEIMDNQMGWDITDFGSGDFQKIGLLIFVLRNAISESERDEETPVTVSMDGRTFEVAAGEPFRVRPGESITLMPEQFHKFWAETGTGKVLLGEVSTVADEAADNNFPEYGGRLPAIAEDVPPGYLIFNDYAVLKDPAAWPETWR